MSVVEAKNKLADLTLFGRWSDVRAGLATLASTARASAAWIESLPRDNATVTHKNILDAVAAYVEVAARELEGPSQVLAFCTRSVYELNLRVRHIFDVPGGVDQWQGELIRDKIDVIEGFLRLRHDGTSPRVIETLELEVHRLRLIAGAHAVTEARPLGAQQLAEANGALDEHRAMFKLYSKLVHPSSYSVNNPIDAQGHEIRNVLVLHLQLYAWSLITKVAQHFGIPDSIAAPDMSQLPSAGR